MEEIDLLIAGLGNPGEKYQNNRHNIGFMIAQAFVNKYRGKFKKYSKYSYIAKLPVSGKNIIICLPMTFMNLSGKALKELADSYKIKSSKIVVICDEYNFPFGKLHYKANGSDGGHNGVGSVIDELEATDFIRLRVGIDKNFGSGELVNYVLSDFNDEENKLLPELIKKGIEALEAVIFSEPVKAMNKINSKEFQAAFLKKEDEKIAKQAENLKIPAEISKNIDKAVEK